MQYRIDQKSGNELSILGFGCMRFPRTLAGSTDVDKSEKILLEAIEKGVNYLDSAWLYPGSEQTIGTILARNKLREKVFIATKLPHRRCTSSADFDRFFSEQLERLQTDYVDYYLIHNISDPTVWQQLCALGIEEWYEEKKKTGQIRQNGFSFHGMRDGFIDLLDVYDWDLAQIQYNYLNENFQAGRAGLEEAHRRGLPVVVMEPLLGGKLANRLPKEAEHLLYEAAPEHSAAAEALRWIWDQAQPTVVLSGMSTLEELRDNLHTAADAVPGLLSEQERAVFEPVRRIIEEAYRVPCTGCDYCMPLEPASPNARKR